MSKTYDLEERTLQFSKTLIVLCKKLPRNTININLVDQCIRSGTSIGANYREANDALGSKDFIFRCKISRKEAKETVYWLELLIEANNDYKGDIKPLLNECLELRNILSAIITKASTNNK